jgi:hypothetical protein
MGYHLATLQTPLVIRDAKVITDMADACLFAAWSTSENKALITDLAEQEFKQGAKWKTIHALIEGGFIEVTDCAEMEMASLVKTRNTHGVNIVDASIIFLCKEKSGIILTEDPKLQASCLQESVSCAEILWVFDHLLHTKKLQFSAALEGLNTLTSRGSRLQIEEVQKRMEAWTQQVALPPMPTPSGLNGSHNKRKAKNPAKTNSPEI